MQDYLNRIKGLMVPMSRTLIEALRTMDSMKTKTLFVFEEDIFKGLLTIGDIQRAIISGANLNQIISEIIDNNKIYASTNDSEASIKESMERLRAQYMPILDSHGELVDVAFWSDYYKRDRTQGKLQVPVPVVIMAGGKGTRLSPLTNVIPKPMIPVGDKTIIEEIMDQFECIGCKEFFVSVNFKVDILKFYLDNLNHKYNITLFKEDRPLGTIGSVSLLKGKVKTPFFVSNCDILIDQDLSEVYNYHVSNRNDITLITAIKSFMIPYGVIETGSEGLMTGLHEKPEETYMINTGVYVLNPELIDEIPDRQFFHITDLIERVKDRKGRVGCFPISENAWKDMGEWPEYLKMINVL